MDWYVLYGGPTCDKPFLYCSLETTHKLKIFSYWSLIASIYNFIDQQVNVLQMQYQDTFSAI